MPPAHLMICLQLCIPARDWHRLEDCVIERYQQVLAKDGQPAADRWARKEALWFGIEGLKRLFHPRFWINPPGL